MRRVGIVQGPRTRQPRGRWYMPWQAVVFEQGRVVERCGHSHVKKERAGVCARLLEKGAAR